MQSPAAVSSRFALPEPPPAIDREGARNLWLVAAVLAPPVTYLLARFIGLGPAPGPWAYWPINGALCGIFFRRAYRDWTLLGLLALITQIATIYLIRGDLAHGATVIGAVVEVVQAALAAWLLRTSPANKHPFASPAGLAWFVTIAVVLAPLVTTPISATAFAGGLQLSWSTVWAPLFAGNSLGMLLFAPPIMSVRATEERIGPWYAARSEQLLGYGLLVIVTFLTFALGRSLLNFAVLPYALFPLLAWSALRCGPRWTSVAIVGVATVAAYYTAREIGPFAAPQSMLADRVLQLQAYLALLALTGLVLCALSEEGRKAFLNLAIQNAVRDGFFKGSNASLVLKNLDGTTVIANQAYADLVGVSEREMVGRSTQEFLSETEAARTRERDEMVRSRGVAMTLDEDYIVKGKLRHFIVTRFPIYGADGVLSYTGVIARDMTVERELASRLERAQRVEMVGHLAAGVAHDLNNLLSTIQLSVALLEAKEGSESRDQELRIGIEDATNRATRLTRRLLSLGRAQEPQPVNIDVDASIRELEPMLRVLVRDLIELRIELDAPGAQVRGDPLMIEQVVLNLVSNARDAIAARGSIVISTSRVSNETVRVTVRDTGDGMSADTLKALFEPFFSTKGQHGTGLGLYTSALLIRQAGGEIRAASEGGKGTTFTMDMPVAGTSPASLTPDAQGNS